MSKHLWIRRPDRSPIIGFRFGKAEHPLFSERYQGTRGIPRRFFHLFGGRLTIIKSSPLSAVVRRAMAEPSPAESEGTP